jgi:Zn-dependent peptidase ImmA (M78 family)
MQMTKKQKYIFYKCAKFTKERLNIQEPFKLVISEDRKSFTTNAYYHPEDKLVAIYTKNRAISDICRSLIHELTHHLDHENGKANKHKNPDIGQMDEKTNIDPTDIENRANAIAGALLKEFAYGLKDKEKIDIYIN